MVANRLDRIIAERTISTKRGYSQASRTHILPSPFACDDHRVVELQLDVATALSTLSLDLQDVARRLMVESEAEMSQTTGLTRERIREAADHIANHFRNLGLQPDF